MYDVSKLDDMRNSSNAALDLLKKESEELTKAIQKAESDTSRTPQYVRESVKALRDKTIPRLRDPIAILQGVARDAEKQARFYESKTFLLSRQKSITLPEIRALETLTMQKDFESMPIEDLKLHFDVAKLEKDYPAVYQAWRAFDARRLEAKNAGIVFDLSDVNLPEQAVGQASIETCAANHREGDSIFSQCAGLRLNPVSKMQYGRKQKEAAVLREKEAAVLASQPKKAKDAD